MAYMNAAGAGLPDASVRQRMIDYLTREAEIGPVAAEAEAVEELTPLRGLLAGLLGAEQDETAFLDWGTLAWNAAVLSLPLAGRRVLVAPGEWASNIALMQRMGAEVEVMPVDGNGALDVAAIAGRIDEDLAAICLPHVCSLTGERYPAEAIGALPRPKTCAYVVDISQSLGQISVSMTALGADILAAPTRKWLRGPKGTGVLAVRREMLARMTPSRVADYATLTWPDGTARDIATARRFEKAGYLVPPRLGLLQALRVQLTNEPVTQARLMALADYSRSKASLTGFALAGAEPLGSAIVTLRAPSETVQAMAQAVAAAGYTLKAATPDCEPLRPAETVAGGFLRISAHVYNSEAEVDALFDILTRAA